MMLANHEKSGGSWPLSTVVYPYGFIRRNSNCGKAGKLFLYEGDLHPHLSGLSLNLSEWASVKEVKFSKDYLYARVSKIGSKFENFEEVLFEEHNSRPKFSMMDDDLKKLIDQMLTNELTHREIHEKTGVKMGTIHLFNISKERKGL